MQSINSYFRKGSGPVVRIRTVLLSCILCIFVLPVGRAAAQVSITAHIFAEIIEALSAAETSQLNFGSFSVQANGGSIVVKPEDGSRTVNGSVTALGMYSIARFTVTGQTDATFSINLPPDDKATVTNLSNSKTMEVTNWKSVPSAGIGTGLLSGGTLVVKVGATLVVGTINDNPAGMYSGTYSILFNYN